MQEKHVDMLGWIATATAVLMYVSYIDQIRLNLSGHPGSLLQPAAMMLNCALWVAYGICKPKRDWPIAVANCPGVVLGAVGLYTLL